MAAVTVALALLAGCRNEAPGPLTAEQVGSTLKQGFAGSSGEAKKLADEADAALKANDPVTAWGVLNEMNQRADLTAEQHEAAARSQQALLIKLQESAAAGNAQAQAAVEAYRASK